MDSRPPALSGIFGLPPGADFPARLVEGLLARMAGAPPEALARVTLFLNTRRMERRVRALFAGSGAVLLPRLRLVTDPADDPVPGLPPAVPALRRRLELMQLVARLIEAQPDLAPRGAAYDLADTLAALMDEMQGEGVQPAVLATLDVSDHAFHWQRSLAFVDLVERWFGSDALPDAGARLRSAVQALAVRWADVPPSGPVIVAGSTGSRGTTALLMRAVAALPQGVLVLPGFDFDLPAPVWAGMGDSLSDEDHPQFRYRRLLQSLDTAPADVRPWVDVPAPSPDRNRLVSLALRPAPVTDSWAAEGPLLTGLDAACAGMALIEAPTPRDEALAIALRLRKAVADGQAAALVTPDRTLARRVTAALDRWGIVPDDSAGRPLGLSVPGRFLRHVAALFTRPLTAEALIVLLRHPLCHGGAGRGGHLRHTRELDLHLRRHGPAYPLPETLRAWAARRPTDADAADWADWLIRVLAPVWQPVEGAMMPDRAGHGASGPDSASSATSSPDPEPGVPGAGTPGGPSGQRGPAAWAPARSEPLAWHLQRHIDLAARLAAGRVPDQAGLRPSHAASSHAAPPDTVAAGIGAIGTAVLQTPSGGLWLEAAGGEARAMVEELQAEAGHGGTMDAQGYADLFEALIARRDVREPVLADPGVMIWGTLEARVQGAALVILGGLNEGVWPALPPPDPWLSRKMRRDAGLLLPERQIGLAAHDFQQAVAAPEVVVSRALRDAENPTVPARWLNRLTHLLGGLPDGRGQLAAMRARGDGWLRLAALLERPGAPEPPAPRPAPCPPLVARPRKLSVTEIERLIRDPYAVYARHVLKLRALDPLHRGADALLRGTVLHLVMEQVLREGTTDPARIMAVGHAVLAETVPWPAARRLWAARLARVADWIAAREAARAGQPVLLEEPGAARLSDLDFTLTARPDRIDLLPDGRLEIIDYKTGTPPSQPMQRHFAKQLLLEAALAEQGAFGRLGPAEVARIVYVGLGANPREVATELKSGEVAAVWKELGQLIAAYGNRDRGYAARRAPASEQWAGEFDHLARFGEWGISDPPVPIVVGGPDLPNAGPGGGTRPKGMGDV